MTKDSTESFLLSNHVIKEKEKKKKCMGTLSCIKGKAIAKSKAIFFLRFQVFSAKYTVTCILYKSVSVLREL